MYYPPGMMYPAPLHQMPGFPYNIGAIPEVVPGVPPGGQNAMKSQHQPQLPRQATMPVPIGHPGMMSFDPRMMMMMNGYPPNMMPYVHPAMMQQMMTQRVPQAMSESSNEEAHSEGPASPQPQRQIPSQQQSIKPRTGGTVQFSQSVPQTPQLAHSRGSFRYPAPPGASAPASAYASPASSALPTPATSNHPNAGGYFAFVPYGSESAQASPTRASGNHTPAALGYDAKADPFAMQAMAPGMNNGTSWARQPRSWYESGGR